MRADPAGRQHRTAGSSASRITEPAQLEIPVQASLATVACPVQREHQSIYWLAEGNLKLQGARYGG